MRNVVSGRLRTIFLVMAALGATAMLALGGAPTAAAVTALTISTTYPSVQVDPGGQVDLPILVESPNAEKVDLSVTGAPDGWKTSFRGGGFIVTSVYTTPSSDTASPAPSDLKLRVEVPDTATPQAYNLTVNAKGPDGTAQLPITLTVATVEGNGVSMDTSVQAKAATVGTSTTFSVTLHNDTAADLTFNVSVPDAPAGWDVTAKPSNDADPNNFTVSGGDTDTISVTADSPSTAAAGDYEFTVVADAGANNTASLKLGVRLTGTETLSLTSQSGTLNSTTSAGTTKDYSVIVVNNGSSVLNNIALDSTPPTDWTITFDPANIAQLQPNTQQTVVAHIQAPGNAVAGDYVVTLSASSGQASDSIDVRTTVETSTLWGYVGIGLIALVIIGLLLVFRRYGRR
jgi:uncharacterized membrane protein